MVFGDNPPSDIVPTRPFNAELLTSERGKSPICGFNQFRKQPSHSSRVETATGLRFRVFTCLIQDTACSRNVTPHSFCFTTLLKYSWVSEPLSMMISRA